MINRPEKVLQICIPGHISSEYPTIETRPVCPSSGSALAAPAAVDRCSVSTPFAADPTAHRAAQRIRPDFAHPLRHCPGWPALAPKRSPDSSADTPCPLTSGPSSLPSGSATRPVSSHGDVRVFHSGNWSSSPSLLIWHSCPCPTLFLRRLPRPTPAADLSVTSLSARFWYHAAVRLLTEHRSPFRCCL